MFIQRHNSGLKYQLLDLVDVFIKIADERRYVVQQWGAGPKQARLFGPRFWQGGWPFVVVPLKIFNKIFLHVISCK